MTKRVTVGRDVHYVSYATAGGEFPSACRAAKVTEVWPPEPDQSTRVSLTIFLPIGWECLREVEEHSGEDTEEDTDLCHGLEYPGGTWHWPEFVRDG